MLQLLVCICQQLKVCAILKQAAINANNSSLELQDRTSALPYHRVLLFLLLIKLTLERKKEE